MAAMLLTSMCAFAQSENNEPLKGDVNGDGKVDVADITAIVKIIMENGGGTAHNYTWYQGLASENQIQNQSYINGLSYNKTTKPTSTVGLSKGYNVFIFPSSWGTPTLYEDEAHTFRWSPYTSQELGITNPSGKNVLVWEAPNPATMFIVWPETYYWYVGTTPITADNYQTLATQVSQYESEFMWTPAERAYVYALVTNDKIVQIIDPSFNVAVDTTVDTTSIKGYSIYKTATKIAVTPVKIKISLQTTYYYYAGWTLPTVSNVDNIISETYPAEGGSTVMHIAGKKTTSKSEMDYTTNSLYNINEKTNYYVLVPTGQAIYDIIGTNVTNSVFSSQGTITVGNQVHTIYKSNSTSRNIGAIIIR